MICGKCGKEMLEEGKGNMIGLSIMINRVSGQHSDEFLDNQLGKYAGNDHYEFCYECLIDAIMRK